VVQGKASVGVLSQIPLQKPEITVSQKLECEPVPNVMAALPNIGGTLC